MTIPIDGGSRTKEIATPVHFVPDQVYDAQIDVLHTSLYTAVCLVHFQGCGCLHQQDLLELKGEVKELKNEVKEATEELKKIKNIVSDVWEFLSKQQRPLQHPYCQTPPPLPSPLQLGHGSPLGRPFVFTNEPPGTKHCLPCSSSSY